MPNKELKFKQIACSEALSEQEYQGSLYGLTEEGEVYRFNEIKDLKGWHKLNMNKYEKSNTQITVRPNLDAFGGDEINTDPFKGFKPPDGGIKSKVHKRNPNNNENTPN